MNTTQRAIQRFVRACNREARFAAYLDQKKYAAELRRGASDVLAKNRRAIPAPIDPDLEKRKAVARAWSATLMNGMH